VEIGSGLNATDRVINNPPDSIVNGQTVHVIAPQAQPKAEAAHAAG